MESTLLIVRWNGKKRTFRAVVSPEGLDHDQAGWTPVKKYTLIDLVQIILYITYTSLSKYELPGPQSTRNVPSIVSKTSCDVTCRRSKVVGFLRITRFVYFASGIGFQVPAAPVGIFPLLTGMKLSHDL